MTESFESIVKLILAAVIIISVFVYWLLPKSTIARNFKMSQTIFVITNFIGVMYGLVGIIITLVWSQKVIDLHLWELFAMPFVLIQCYWAVVLKSRKAEGTFDEKQDLDMTKAAALTWAFSIPAMVLLFVLEQNGFLTGALWFPYYLFSTLMFYSATTLYLFKKA